MRTEILLDHEPAADGRVVRLLLRVQSEAAARAERRPLNLSLVLDRSGSMHGAKLAAARDAAAMLVRRLSPDDTVSVVAYDDTVTTVAAPAKGDAQATLPREIERIETGGSTNLSGGWLRGREFVAQNLLPTGVNRVILLTDGLANVGIRDPQQLTGLAAQAKAAGVTTTAIGFGSDYDERLLRAMADAGGGSMYYIENVDQAASIFGDELQDLFDLGAQNVAVLVRPGPAARLMAVHHDYASTAGPDGLRIELGDVYAREPKPLLVEMLVAGNTAGETKVAELVVSGDVITEAGIERQVITLPVLLDAAAAPHVEPEVQRELLLQVAAKARREALERRDRGDWDGAAGVLAAAAEKLERAEIADASLREEAEDARAMSRRLASRADSAADRKYMYQRSYDAQRGRSFKQELIRRMKKEEPPEA